MRRCKEVLARVGVHGASLTATVSRIAEILPVEQAHINPRVLVPDTSVSTDLTIHPSLRTACDTALHHSPKAYAQALHSRISTLEQCDPNPSIQNEAPAYIPALLTPDSPLDARYSSIRTPSFPPPPKCTSPSSLDACAAPPLLFPPSRPSVSCPSTRQRGQEWRGTNHTTHQPQPQQHTTATHHTPHTTHHRRQRNPARSGGE